MKNAVVPVLVVIIVILVVALLLVLRNSASTAPAVPTAAPTQTQTTAPAAPAAPAAPSPRPTSAAAVGRANPAHVRYLPDTKLTPGDVLDVSKSDVCERGYSSKVRDVPESVKDEVYREYGIASHKPGQYEVDHLISLELGGSNSIKNLWPESYTGSWNAHEKDKVEDRLHAEVCNGTVDLKTAQREIAGDWITAYVKYFGQPK